MCMFCVVSYKEMFFIVLVLCATAYLFIPKRGGRGRDASVPA